MYFYQDAFLTSCTVERDDMCPTM